MFLLRLMVSYPGDVICGSRSKGAVSASAAAAAAAAAALLLLVAMPDMNSMQRQHYRSES